MRFQRNLLSAQNKFIHFLRHQLPTEQCPNKNTF
uniref:Uncharacterized protein n=1 Tax=Anguilla anguilla TaxID=7936 RepID=A0A0E9SYQ9_ANGAN